MVIHVKARDVYDMGEGDEDDTTIEVTDQLVELEHFDDLIPDEDEQIPAVR